MVKSVSDRVNGRMSESVKEALEEEGSVYETRFLQSLIPGLTRCSGNTSSLAMGLLQKHTVDSWGSMTEVNMFMWTSELLDPASPALRVFLEKYWNPDPVYVVQ